MQHTARPFRLALLGSAIAAAALLGPCGPNAERDDNAGKPAPTEDASTALDEAPAALLEEMCIAGYRALGCRDY